MSGTAAAAGREGPAAGASARDGESLARTVFVVLVLACLVAFFVTQRLKHTPTAVQEFKLTTFFSPTAAGHLKEEAISFKIEHTDEVTVQVIDTSGNVVATLVRDRPLHRYRHISLRWNGRRGTAVKVSDQVSADGHVALLADTAGRPAPAGEYRAQVILRGRGGPPILSPHNFTLVR